MAIKIKSKGQEIMLGHSDDSRNFFLGWLLTKFNKEII